MVDSMRFIHYPFCSLMVKRSESEAFSFCTDICSTSPGSIIRHYGKYPIKIRYLNGLSVRNTVTVCCQVRPGAVRRKPFLTTLTSLLCITAISDLTISADIRNSEQCHHVLTSECPVHSCQSYNDKESLCLYNFRSYLLVRLKSIYSYFYAISPVILLQWLQYIYAKCVQ